MLETLTTLETSNNGLQQTWYNELLGVITEVYLYVAFAFVYPNAIDIFVRARSRIEEDEQTRNVLTARWKTAHDLCSIVALNSAFEDCRDDDSYDLGELNPQI